MNFARYINFILLTMSTHQRQYTDKLPADILRLIYRGAQVSADNSKQQR